MRVSIYPAYGIITPTRHLKVILFVLEFNLIKDSKCLTILLKLIKQ